MFMHSIQIRFSRLILGVLVTGAGLAQHVWAVDIEGTLPVAIDQPRVYGLMQGGAGGKPYTGDYGFGIKTFNIQGFLDTGASGVILSTSTTDSLGIPRVPGAIFADVGIGGATEFDVSQPVLMRIAPSTEPDLDNPATYNTVYSQAYGPLVAQLGPRDVVPDPLSDPIDVFGMPVMTGKVVVMDPRPLNDLSDTMHTFIYNPGTSFHPGSVGTNPGIPTTNLHVSLSYGSFDRFTQTTPSDAAPPTQAHNPFIGPNPVAKLDPNAPADNTPPIGLDFQGVHATGSFLLDTGSVTSFISTDLASKLHVRYVAGTFGGDNPRLELFDPNNPSAPGTEIANQSTLPVQGLGGAVTVAGFFLDDLIVHTQEGGANDANPLNIRYVHAPIYVNDVTLQDPLTHDTLTLDGIFGMNNLVASASFDGLIGDVVGGAYDWIVFDEPNGVLGLQLPGVTVPEPSSLVLALAGAAVPMYCVWQRRRRRASNLST